MAFIAAEHLSFGRANLACLTLSRDLRELLTANVAIELGLVQPAQAAEALRAYCEADDRAAFSMIDALERDAGLLGDGRKRLLAEVSRRLVADETAAPLRDVKPERYVDFQSVKRNWTLVQSSYVFSAQSTQSI